MRSLLTVVAVLLVLNQGFAAISDNLCDTPCEFCCRNHVCQTQEYCTSGNTNYYGIIGGVAGGIVGLILLRVIWVKVIRPRCCKQRAMKESDEPKSRARRHRNPDEGDGKKKQQKKKGTPLKKKKTTTGEDLESKGDKKPEKYDPLFANSISTPNASILNKPEINGSVISHSKQDLENPEIIKADLKPRSRNNMDEPPKEQAISKGASHKSNDKKSGGDKKASSSKDKSKHGGERSKSKEKSGGERSKSKEKSGSQMDKSSKKKEIAMASSSRSKRDDSDARKARDHGNNQV